MSASPVTELEKAIDRNRSSLTVAPSVLRELSQQLTAQAKTKRALGEVLLAEAALLSGTFAVAASHLQAAREIDPACEVRFGGEPAGLMWVAGVLGVLRIPF